MKNLIKFPWNKKNDKLKNDMMISISNFLSQNDPDLRISYKNIHGDEEACEYKDFLNQNRSTKNTNDITRLYLYFDTYMVIIRLKTLEIVNNENGREIIKLQKEDIDKIIALLNKIKHETY